MLSELFELQVEIVKPVSLGFKRYLYQEIDWNNRLVAVVGARGVGKTTLLIQYYKEKYGLPDKCLYLSADNVRVASAGLFEIASEFFKLGGEMLMIDEIHKYEDWSRELKNIYDSFPSARLAISGSSSLGILKGRHDLSRRIVVYNLCGLSFREFLFLEAKENFGVYNFADILDNHTKYATKICNKIKVLKYFRDYLKYGFYPFFLEGTKSYDSKLNNIVEKIIYEDIPLLFGIKISSTHLLKKIVFLVATSQPFVPNIEKISSQLGISKEYVYNYLEYLEKAHLFSFLYAQEQGFKLVRKSEKIYLENSNLFHAVLGQIGFKSEIGAVRESFFLNQLKVNHKVFSSERGDFSVDEKYVFEVGGKSKDNKQIRDIKNAFIVADDIEVGAGNKIPLWLFGFLY